MPSSADAAHAQVRQEHAAAGVCARRVARAGVVQQAVAGRLDQQRHALADVEGGDAKSCPARDGRASAAAAAARPVAPAQRCGQPRGISIHSVPPSASRNTQACGAGARHTPAAAPPSEQHRQAFPQPTACASRQHPAASGAGSRLPSSASGVTTKLTSGIATAFASGLTSETWPNSSIVSGTRPSVTDTGFGRHLQRFARHPVSRADPAMAADTGSPPPPRTTARSPATARPRDRAAAPRRAPRTARATRCQPPGPQRQPPPRQHVQRALGRHAEAGQQHVQQRGPAPASAAPFAPAAAAAAGRR
jgi:hypothetical protein